MGYSLWGCEDWDMTEQVIQLSQFRTAEACAGMLSRVLLFVTPRTPTRLFCPWNSPDKNTGVDCHFLAANRIAG